MVNICSKPIFKWGLLAKTSAMANESFEKFIL